MVDFLERSSDSPIYIPRPHSAFEWLQDRNHLEIHKDRDSQWFAQFPDCEDRDNQTVRYPFRNSTRYLSGSTQTGSRVSERSTDERAPHYKSKSLHENPERSNDGLDSRRNENSFPKHLGEPPEPAYLRSQRATDPYDQVNGPNFIFGARQDFHEKLLRGTQYAQERSEQLRRPKWFQLFLRIGGYALLLCIVYFVFVGWPLWHGAIYGFWHVYKNQLDLAAGWAIFLGISFLYAVIPLFVLFENHVDLNEKEIARNFARAADTAIVIPCHKSENSIGATLAAAVRTFPARNIFVVANGNSDTPLDNTDHVCQRFGVRHIWVPLGAKVVAQYVGVNAAYMFPYVLLMDDDCILPVNFPVVTDRLEYGWNNGRTKCIGYTLHSVGENGKKGTLCQQAQDLEYKLSGLQRYFWGLWGSAPFAHGAIALWDRDFLLECFRSHPGFTISEDWFFGLVSRRLGGRIKMCSKVFVPTETPRNLLSSGDGSRAGYGEMTVTRQRMLRWNFFLVSRMWYNVKYMLFSWNLGWLEVGTKLEVFRETYETLLLLSTPIILPISIAIRPGFTIGVTCAVLLMYSVAVILFNEVHLRRKRVEISRSVVILYFPLYKMYLRLINVVSCYVAIFRYACYFQKRHPNVLENERAMQTMLKLSSEQFIGANYANINIIKNSMEKPIDNLPA